MIRRPASRFHRIVVEVASIAVSVLFIRTVAIAHTPEDPQSSDQSEITLHASTSLVLVDAIAQDPRHELVPSSLKQEDFEIRDNGRPIPIASFDDSTTFGTRPITLWFVVICNEDNNLNGSGMFKGREQLFRPALDSLNQHDGVGVAHWCDNGEAEVDLSPTPDRDAAIQALAKALHPIAWIAPAPQYRRLGELAFQWMLELLIDQAHATRPESLPVIVCLYGDHSGQPAAELDRLLDYLLSTSGFVYGIKDRAIPDYFAAMPGHRPQVLHYLADQTGGEYFAVKSDQYATALQEILVQVHSRYGLGIRPVMDGKRHKLTMALTSPAHQRYKSVKLRYRTGYTTEFPMNTLADPLAIANLEDAPIPRRLVFKAKVSRSSPSAASSQPGLSLQHYAVEYSIPQQELKFASDSQDKHVYSVQFAVLVYDRDGNKLDEVRNSTNFRIDSERFDEVRKNGIQARQTFDISDAPRCFALSPEISLAERLEWQMSLFQLPLPFKIERGQTMTARHSGHHENCATCGWRTVNRQRSSVDVSRHGCTGTAQSKGQLRRRTEICATGTAQRMGV